MIYNIGILGSCASRDIFYSEINRNYKKYFNCPAFSHRSSIISIMQDPFHYNNEDIKILPETRINKAGELSIKYDLEKSFLNEMINNKIDYLLIDNYFEVKFGILEFNNGEMITNNYWDLPKTTFYKNLNNKNNINMFNNPNKFFKLWTEHFDLFY